MFLAVARAVVTNAAPWGRCSFTALLLF